MYSSSVPTHQEKVKHLIYLKVDEIRLYIQFNVKHMSFCLKYNMLYHHESKGICI